MIAIGIIISSSAIGNLMLDIWMMQEQVFVFMAEPFCFYNLTPL